MYKQRTHSPVHTSAKLTHDTRLLEIRDRTWDRQLMQVLFCQPCSHLTTICASLSVSSFVHRAAISIPSFVHRATISIPSFVRLSLSHHPCVCPYPIICTSLSVPQSVHLYLLYISLYPTSCISLSYRLYIYLYPTICTSIYPSTTCTSLSVSLSLSHHLYI